RWRRSKGRTRRASDRPAPWVMLVTVSRDMRGSLGSEQEVTLCQWQHGGRFAGEQLAIRAHFVGLRIDLDVRLVVVQHQVALADGTGAAHGAEAFAQAQPGADVRLECSLGHE